MYETFNDNGPKSTSSAEDIVIGDIVSSPEISPSHESKDSSPFSPTKGPAPSPPKRKKIPLPKGFRSSSQDAPASNGGEVRESKGFSPTSACVSLSVSTLVGEDED